VRPGRDEELVVLGGRGHRAPRARRVTGPQLMEEPLVLREEGAGTRAVVHAALRRRRWQPRRTFEVNSTEAIKGLVSAGVGWAVLSLRIVPHDLHLPRLKRLHLPDFPL